MDIPFLSQDYDPELMETKDATYFTRHLEDFHANLNNYLKSNNILYNFIGPYLNDFFDIKKTYINSGMDRFEARSVALKETLARLDDFCENSLNTDSIDATILDKFDLDKNNVIDTDTI